MFVEFFYRLREKGIPVSPTSFLRLQKALRTGLVASLEDFYVVARAILVKSERYFDLYDQVFAVSFRGETTRGDEEINFTEAVRALLEEWLKAPGELASLMGLTEEDIQGMTPEELIAYFRKLLEEQKEAHHGGSRWLGTGGTAPVGHSGYHPGGMRVGGSSRSRSAVKVALERRYRDYSQEGPLTESQLGEALKRLRRLTPSGPRDQVNIEKTIVRTVKNAGEIEIAFDRRLVDRLKIILMIDNGGWSMDPYVGLVQILFDYARSQFKDLTTYYFHNTIYQAVWKDPERYHQPESLEDLTRKDPESRLVLVGDASMAPYELLQPGGSIYSQTRGSPSIERLKLLARTFRHGVWLNPVPAGHWPETHTIGLIGEIFPMFELTLDGLDEAVACLLRRH
jgi:uncharacterized protein with von Willebrand factor type A (vWA) domain